MEYICLDCERQFDDPIRHCDSHGLDTPPYERHTCCPYCGEDYVKLMFCDCCDKPILGNYIKTNDGDIVCENCYTVCDIAEAV